MKTARAEKADKSEKPARRDAGERKLELAEVLRLLEEDGLVGADDLQRLRLHRLPHGSDPHPLVRIGDINPINAKDSTRTLSTEFLTEWLAARTGMPYLHIDPLKVDVARVCGIVSHAYATRFHILPISVDAGELVVATAEPFEREWLGALEQAARMRIRPVLANPRDIRRYLAEFYSLARSVRSAMDKHRALPSGITNFEQLVQLGQGSNIDANDQAVVHIVDWLLQYAFEQRASDIHIEPRREECLVRFRIDGVMHMVYQAPMQIMAAITNRIKLLARMDVVEKRRPQDGRIKTKTPKGDEIELRLSSMPTAFGEKLVIRIFNPEMLLKSFGELGLSDEERTQWQSLIRQPHGIILVTGPTGSGKTTTLYSTLRELATPEVNVCTVEDPIEMVYPHLNQMQVQHNIGLDFASGVRTLMRQDPDIIMVGEIRDLETAEMAVQAALTGHLVFSTLHTNDAPSAITRLMDLGVPPYLIRATVLGVMAQRLTRSVCPHCKQTTTLDELQWTDFISPWKSAMPAQAVSAAGCLECRMTGYLGRAGIYEMMIMTPNLRQLVVEGVDMAKLRQAAVREGMRPLRISGALKVAAGVTTLEEVARTTPPATGN